MTELKRSDFSKICRTCLLQKDNMEPIHKSDIPRMLLSFTNIKVETEDDILLPKLICATCIDKIYGCYEFKMQCELNNNILQMCVKKRERPVDSVIFNHENEHHLNRLSNEIKHETQNFKNESVIDNNTVVRKKNKKNMRQNDNLKKKYSANKTEVCSNKTIEKIDKYTNKNEEDINENEEYTNMTENYFNESIQMNDDEDSKRSSNSDCGNDNKIVKKIKRKCKSLRKTGQLHTSCNFCEKKFVDQYVLKRHIENIHTKIRKKQTCEICKRDVMCMKLHMRRKHNGEFKYKCRNSNCEAKFLYKSHLTEHVREKHTEETVKRERLLCTNCGKILRSRKAYGYHMLSHSGEKPFQCSFCVKKFRSHNYLKIHERSHTDERPYQCTYCERAFRDNSTLKGHIRTHTGEKPFICSICGRGFAQRIAMKTHLKIH